MSTTSKLSHRRNLLFAKAFFFVSTLSSVGWTKFQNNFYLEKGLSAFEIGSLKSVGLLLKVIGEPFWSIVADVTDPKAIYALCIIVQIVTMEILRTASPLTVAIIFYVKIFRSITSTSSNLVTTAAFHLTEGTSEGYGRQRMFAAIAWGFGAYLFGVAIDTYGMSSLFFYTYLFVGLNFLLVLMAFPAKPAQQTHENTKNKSIYTHACANVNSYAKDLRQFFENAPCRVVLLSAIFYGAVMTVPDTFLFISLEKDYHASRGFSGWMTVVSILSELPIFWYSDYIIASLGHFNMKAVAFITCIFRLCVLSILPVDNAYSLSIILFCQLIHGVNFGMFWVSAADAIYKLSPDNLLTSSMASLNMAYFTCGGTIGNYIWGWVYDHYGGVWYVYIGGAIFLSIVLLFFRNQEVTLSAGLAHSEESERDDLLVNP